MKKILCSMISVLLLCCSVNVPGEETKGPVREIWKIEEEIKAEETNLIALEETLEGHKTDIEKLRTLREKLQRPPFSKMAEINSQIKAKEAAIEKKESLGLLYNREIEHLKDEIEELKREWKKEERALNKHLEEHPIRILDFTSTPYTFRSYKDLIDKGKELYGFIVEILPKDIARSKKRIAKLNAELKRAITLKEAESEAEIDDPDILGRVWKGIEGNRNVATIWIRQGDSNIWDITVGDNRHKYEATVSFNGNEVTANSKLVKGKYKGATAYYKGTIQGRKIIGNSKESKWVYNGTAHELKWTATIEQ
jgi:DNA repair exonuclease SbcCD ATPase subunit